MVLNNTARERKITHVTGYVKSVANSMVIRIDIVWYCRVYHNYVSTFSYHCW